MRFVLLTNFHKQALRRTGAYLQFVQFSSELFDTRTAERYDLPGSGIFVILCCLAKHFKRSVVLLGEIYFFILHTPSFSATFFANSIPSKEQGFSSISIIIFYSFIFHLCIFIAFMQEPHHIELEFYAPRLIPRRPCPLDSIRKYFFSSKRIPPVICITLSAVVRNLLSTFLHPITGRLLDLRRNYGSRISTAKIFLWALILIRNVVDVEQKVQVLCGAAPGLI